MRGAFGKPQGTVARVNIGQVLLSVRARDQHKDKVIEALRRAKFKFPGRQKVGMQTMLKLVMGAGKNQVIWLVLKFKTWLPEVVPDWLECILDKVTFCDIY